MTFLSLFPFLSPVIHTCICTHINISKWYALQKVGSLGAYWEGILAHTKNKNVIHVHVFKDDYDVSGSLRVDKMAYFNIRYVGLKRTYEEDPYMTSFVLLKTLFQQ